VVVVVAADLASTLAFFDLGIARCVGRAERRRAVEKRKREERRRAMRVKRCNRNEIQRKDE